MNIQNNDCSTWATHSCNHIIHNSSSMGTEWGLEYHSLTGVNQSIRVMIYMFLKCMF